MTLRDQAIAAAALEADRAKQYEADQRAERTAVLAKSMKEVFPDSEPEFVYTDEIDYPTERNQQFGGTYLEEHTAEVTAFDIDGVRFVHLKHSASGMTFRHWVLEKECVTCGGRAFGTQRQSGSSPCGSTLSLGTSESGRERMLKDIGTALQAEIYCIPCLLRLPKTCPTCQHKLRS